MSDTSNEKKKSRTSGKTPAKKGQRQGASRRANKNGVLIILLTIIVIAAVIGGVIFNFRNKSTGGSSSASEPSISVEANTSLEHNKYPEINELISNYRKAILEEDAELLKKVYHTDIDVNEKILEGSSSIIAGYNNTQYYTKPGINQGDYVAFVYDELKIRDINTQAPNLSVFYIKTAEDNSKYIYRGEYNEQTGAFVLDQQTQDYIQSLYENADVAELIASVNEKMESACAKDKDLAEFVKQLRGRTGAQTETELQTEKATEAETVAQTESAAETESETEEKAE